MSDGTLTIQINNVAQMFQFEETGNTDPQALQFDAGTRAITVLQDGAWDLVFNANGFSFNDNPVGFPKGQPPNVTLTAHNRTTFTLSNQVTQKQPLIEFLIHSDIRNLQPLDPTIFNNPPPDFVTVWEPVAVEVC